MNRYCSQNINQREPSESTGLISPVKRVACKNRHGADVKSKFFREVFQQLENIESEEGIKQCCENFCRVADLEYYIYAIIRSVSSLSSPEIYTYTNYPNDWFNSYFDEGMQKHDPVVKYCFENTTPIHWDKLIQMEKYIDPVGVKIMERAATIGLVNGLSMPLKTPNGEVAIFSLASCRSDAIEDRLLDVLPHAQTFGSQLFQTFYRLKSENPEFNQRKLTARELECLFWACEGKTTWEISKIVDVTERTIIFHLTSATKKLGAVNRQHAVAKAIISGLIKPAP